LLLTVPYRPGFGAVSKVKHTGGPNIYYSDFARENCSRSWIKPITSTANMDGTNKRYIKPPNRREERIDAADAGAERTARQITKKKYKTAFHDIVLKVL
jgi:hypothetical protein